MSTKTEEWTSEHDELVDYMEAKQKVMTPARPLMSEPVDLDQWKAILAKMTPGPWYGPGLANGVRHLERNCSDWYYDDLPDDHSLPGRQNGDGGSGDGEGIAYLRNHAPALLDEVVALREQVAAALDTLRSEMTHHSFVVSGLRGQLWKAVCDRVAAQAEVVALRAQREALRKALDESVRCHIESRHPNLIDMYDALKAGGA